MINQFNLSSNTLKEIKIACVMDTFTRDCYMPECQLFELTPIHWKQEIEECEPHLVFIESAWKGKENLWYKKIANGSKECFEMCTYCRQKNIPIVFWNKEDPIYTETFMNVARMADVVFTTDIDCIPKYKTRLNHDQVYHLHFAAQPTRHNPIERYDRQDKYCFAGAYYHNYTERCKVFDTFAKYFIETKGLDIYDRNYHNPEAEYTYPFIYSPYIRGGLEGSEIDQAYKGYYFGINMNSIDQSQTMFARRVFEMLASNTMVIGNYSRGVKNYFGDLTICTDDSKTLAQNINTWCTDQSCLKKYRALGLRKVLSEHLYEDRLNYIVKKVFNKTLKKDLPFIHIVSEVKSEEETKYIMQNFYKQSYTNKKLYLINNSPMQIEDTGVQVITKEKLEDLVSQLNNADYITFYNSNHYYGANYLLDLILSTRYGNFVGIGKAAYYENKDNKRIIHNELQAYKLTDTLEIDKSIIKCEVVKKYHLRQLIQENKLTHKNLLGIDPYNFCENYTGESCIEVDDLSISDEGLSMPFIEQIAEAIKPTAYINEVLILKPQDLYSLTKHALSIVITLDQLERELIIQSQLPEGNIYYIHLDEYFCIKKYIQNDQLTMLFNGIGSLDNIGTCIFYDENKVKLSAVFTQYNRVLVAEVPKQASYFKLSFRIKGNGVFKVSELIIGATKLHEEKACFLSRSNVLVLSNQYPSEKALYRNMFVHKRMTAYKQEGYTYDVMKINSKAQNEYSEFEGINVVSGQCEVLGNILEKGNIDTVCVHFLDQLMWSVLQNFKDKLRIIIWIHGAEIQPWWRRKYNYNTLQERERGVIASNERMDLWAKVFKAIEDYNIHFIFVSQYFADEVFKDNQIQLSKANYTIIHNCIDTNMFNYVEKTADQRKRFLSIRPYASNKYANDLTVKAIVALSKETYFDDMVFKLIGSGEMFEKTLEPLRKYKNVSIEEAFLRQDEIAQIHKNYGVFITPTRMDAQGVSRDEAMASGLVPITNEVAAIPEFVDEACGILVPPEDYQLIAEGMKKIYEDEAYFLKLSYNAARRVRKQSSKQFTIDREILIIQEYI